MLRVAALMFSLWSLLFAAPATAQVSISPRTSPALGTTVRGSTATTFSISTNGAVTRTSGDAIRLSSSAVNAPTVSFSCGLLNLGGLCALRYMRVTITPADSGPVSISRFRISNLSGTQFRNGAPPAEAQVLVFDLNPLGLLATGSFRLGMDVLLGPGTTSGSYGIAYTVTIELI